MTDAQRAYLDRCTKIIDRAAKAKMGIDQITSCFGIPKHVIMAILENDHEAVFPENKRGGKKNGEEYMSLQMKQAVMSEALSGKPSREIRRKYSLSKRQYRSIVGSLSARKQTTPAASRSTSCVDFPSETATKLMGIKTSYAILAEKYPKAVEEALAEHRAMKSQTMHIAPDKLDWYFAWPQGTIGLEHVLLDLYEFLKVMLSKSTPCVVGCKLEGLRLRTSTSVGELPTKVAETITKAAEQWWRDPKVVEALYARIGSQDMTLNPYKSFGF